MMIFTAYGENLLGVTRPLYDLMTDFAVGRARIIKACDAVVLPTFVDSMLARLSEIKPASPEGRAALAMMACVIDGTSRSHDLAAREATLKCAEPAASALAEMLDRLDQLRAAVMLERAGFVPR